MDFSFTEEEQSFRREVCQFLDKEFPAEWEVPSSFLVFGDDELWTITRRMARKLGEKGWLSVAWPKEYGGQDSLMKQVILTDEMGYRGVPGIDPFGVKMLAPTLIAFGTKEQKEKHLGPIAKGKITWCQGFSEPDAGSDLASVRTQAREENDYFVINGQKVWTTGGHRADWCFFLARTDPEVPKSKGLSFFMVDMKTPGITTPPLDNILGERCFCEVYFDEVKVAKQNLVGGKNQGWRVTTSLLGFERSMIEYSAECRRFLEKLARFVRERNSTGDSIWINESIVWHKLAELAVEIEAARWLAYRVAWLQSTGHDASYEAAMSKVYGSELTQRVASTAMQILGLYGQLEPGSEEAPLKGWMEKWYLSSIGRTIGGGTSEIQRLVIATRGLGMPR